jgi:hypothetical protein
MKTAGQIAFETYWNNEHITKVGQAPLGWELQSTKTKDVWNNVAEAVLQGLEKFTQSVAIQVGDYVRVTKTPDPWEGCGESKEFRESLVGHIGIVIEVGADTYINDECLLIAFVWRNGSGDASGFQRNIEHDSLELVYRPEMTLDATDMEGEWDVD